MRMRALLPLIAAASALVAVTLAAGLTPAHGTTVTAAAVQKLCPGGSIVGYTAKCPTAGTVRKLCADGSVVAYSAKCPAVAVTYTLAGWTALAGNHEKFTAVRSSGATAGLVTFATADATAHAGTDYVATRVTVTFTIGQTTAYANVPTLINPAAAGTNLQFYGMLIAGGRTAASAGATIMEPAAPLLPPATITCPDGSVIPAGQTCPVPPPPPAPMPMPLTIGGMARAGSACPSVINAANVLTAGATYKVEGFAGWSLQGNPPPPAGTRDVVILSGGVGHLGDGWFAYWVPASCVSGA